MNSQPFEISYAAVYIKDAEQYVISGVSDFKNGHSCRVRECYGNKTMIITKLEWENDFIFFNSTIEYQNFKKIISRNININNILDEYRTI